MKVLVTGGAGYIGSHVTYQLMQKGHQVVVIDNLSTGKKESVLDAELIVGDIGDLPLVDKLIKQKGIEAILHFAGNIVVPESVENPLKYYANNTKNSLELIRLAHQNKIDKFIFSSTAAVYGMPESGVCHEQTPTIPINPYGRSKLMTEWMLEDLAYSSTFRYVALRYFNVAGAHVGGLLGQCSPLSTHLIKVACETSLGKRESMAIFGTDYDTKDGSCVRDYIHIDDLAHAHILALDFLANGGQSQILNCGYGHGHTVKEVIETVKRISGVDFKVIESARREGDSPFLISQANKIKEVLGWKPKYNDLDLMVKTARDWEAKL